jgi:hypothetical protein
MIIHLLIFHIPICPHHEAVLENHRNLVFPSTSSFVSSRPLPCPSGHAILNDMFLSQHVTGIRASIFHSTQDHLRFLSSLHGLDVSSLSSMRNLKLCLLFHIINGDCFSDRCSASRPSADRSACLSIASAFPSPLAITEFTVQLLKASEPSVLSTDNLLLIVESTGTQGPYENRPEDHASKKKKTRQPAELDRMDDK